MTVKYSTQRKTYDISNVLLCFCGKTLKSIKNCESNDPLCMENVSHNWRQSYKSDQEHFFQSKWLPIFKLVKCFSVRLWSSCSIKKSCSLRIRIKFLKLSSFLLLYGDKKAFLLKIMHAENISWFCDMHNCNTCHSPKFHEY